MGQVMIMRRGGENRRLPTFTYTGNYYVLDDGGNNWRIKFTSSGILTVEQQITVDAFLVGGGSGGGPTAGSAGGGAGGYSKTVEKVILQAQTPYTITIGAGGAINTKGAQTTAFQNTALGGVQPPVAGANVGGVGGSGGTGGGGGNSGKGGSNGSNGVSGTMSRGGTGQGTTTREFGDADGSLYSGGGGAYPSGAGGAGGGAASHGSAQANTGGGGGFQGRGGSGIVIIRNIRA